MLKTDVGSPLDVFWVDPTGKEVPSGTVKHGPRGFQMNSFVGHAWRVRHAEDGTLMAEVTIPWSAAGDRHTVGSLSLSFPAPIS